MEPKINELDESQKTPNESTSYSSPLEIVMKSPEEELYETASEEDTDFENDKNNSETNVDDLPLDDPLCFSPPKHSRAIKKKNQRRKSELKNKLLMNSADYLDKKSTEEISSITDSLRNMQDQQVTAEYTSSISAPVSSVITSNTSRPFGSFNYPISNSDISWSESRLNNISDTSLIKTSSSSVDLDLLGFKEQEAKDKSFKRIDILLKLALRNNQQSNRTSFETHAAPPPTPSTSSILSRQSGPFANEMIYSSEPDHYSRQSSITSALCLTPTNYQQFNHHDEMAKKLKAENIWKQIYDYFEYYNDRANNNEELIDRRLNEARAIIPTIVEDTLSTNFTMITSHMNQEILLSMKMPSDYSYLYERKNYIDQFCYLFWLVEDVCNRVSYIETLYPSTKIMSRSQTQYASEKFQSVNKSLWLWYKIVFELMHTCDVVGNYLGFTKKDENKKYWTWFNYKNGSNQRLNFSKVEFETFQNWLNESLAANISKLTESPSICVTKPSFEHAETFIQQQKTHFAHLKPSGHRRQISFEHKNTKSTLNLIEDSPAISNNNLSFNLENEPSKPDIKAQCPTPNMNLKEIVSSLFTLKKTEEENEHLKAVKLHHLNSFLSRSSSYRSNDSPSSGLSSSFSFSLSDFQTNKSADVGFYLSDNLETELNDLNKLKDDERVKASFEIEDKSDSSGDFSSKIQKKTTAPYTDSNLYTNRQKIFRDFLHKRMRKQGLTKMCEEIRKVVLDPLSNALHALQIDRCERKNESCETYCYYHLLPLHYQCINYINRFPVDEETTLHGIRSESFRHLDLPSFRPLYMYLINVIIDLMHMCIKMQIENKRDMNRDSKFKISLFSIEALTNECKECIEQAILTRQFYYHMVYSVFERNELDVQNALANDLVKYDDDLKQLIDIYLCFITDWIHDLVTTQDLSKALHVLEVEWEFCKNNLYFVTSSEDMYAKRFCTMCNYLFEGSLSESLSFIDSERENLMEYMSNIEMNDDNDELNSLKHQSDEVNNQENASNNVGDGDEFEDELINQNEINQYYDDFGPENAESFNVNSKCNEFKDEVNQLRKKTMKALEFCGKLLDDLELAAKYKVTSSVQELLNQLKASNHVLVSFTNPELISPPQSNTTSSKSSIDPTPVNSTSNFTKIESNTQSNTQGSSFLIFVPQEFSKDKTQIVRLLFIISEKNDFENTQNIRPEKSKNVTFSKQASSSSNSVRRLSSSNSFFDLNNDNQIHRCINKLGNIAHKFSNMNQLNENTPTDNTPNSPFTISPITKMNGYLLYLQLPKSLNEEFVWDGPSTYLYASMPVKRSLYQHKNNYETSSTISLILVTPKQKILNEKKIEIKSKLKCISLLREKTSFHPNIEYAIDELKDHILEFRKKAVECIRKIETNLKNSIHNENEDNCHMHHVIDQVKLSEIWRVSYNLGIDLQNECIKFMTQDRAEEFSLCLSEFAVMWCNYILNKTAPGKGNTTRPWAANKGIQLLQIAWEKAYRHNTDDQDFIRLMKAIDQCIRHVIGERSNSIKSSHSMTISNDPKCKIIDHHPISSPSLNIEKFNKLPPKQRFLQACEKRDIEIEGDLLKTKSIGKIQPVNRAQQQQVITSTEVSFRWQLGLLIGEGQYGKVFSCVNLENGEPMAMKSIPFKMNQIQTIQDIANEINNLQSINHENLVKFYGAELNRKEILIFMEFCGNQCTLDRLSREASGLPEKIIRHYTKSLLKAVECLHENEIMHRDIKGANIFLKSIDPKQPDKIVLKLGDFGCSVKFKDPIDPTNSKAAQATGFVGTIAFMAPEVSKCSGARDSGCYSYGADIWSLGCVVIEMFTGKLPWHPFKDENIIYLVHIKQTQQKPTYPPDLIEEAENFLNCCLEFEPEKRSTADKLLDHPFVKIPNND